MNTRSELSQERHSIKVGESATAVAEVLGKMHRGKVEPKRTLIPKFVEVALTNRFKHGTPKAAGKPVTVNFVRNYWDDIKLECARRGVFVLCGVHGSPMGTRLGTRAEFEQWVKNTLVPRLEGDVKIHNAYIDAVNHYGGDMPHMGTPQFLLKDRN